MPTKTSGQAPFTFSLCDDLYTLPEKALPFEVDLHGGFAVDSEGSGHTYYGMPGCGLIRISPDLTRQEIIELPSDLKPINFHSTRIVEFDGKRRLVLPANDDAMVVVVGLDGALDFTLSKPEDSSSVLRSHIELVPDSCQSARLASCPGRWSVRNTASSTGPTSSRFIAMPFTRVNAS